MKRLIAVASLLSLLGCSSSEFRRIRCWDEALFPPTKQQVQNVTGWPEDGYVFSTKTGQLYEWDNFQERYLPTAEWQTALVGNTLKIRNPYWFEDQREVDFKKLTAREKVGSAPALEMKCLELPIKHPVGKPGS